MSGNRLRCETVQDARTIMINRLTEQVRCEARQEASEPHGGLTKRCT